MNCHPLFGRPENMTLVAICARQTIRNIGIGGILWGLLNTAHGIVALEETILNVGLVGLGVLMIGTGIAALVHSTLTMLLVESLVGFLLFLWNAIVSLLNMAAGEPPNPLILIFPLIITVVFFLQYWRLRHLRAHVDSLGAEELKRAREMCKTLFKEKLKTSPTVAQTTTGCRVQLLETGVFCAQRNLSRAFHLARNEFLDSIKDLEAKTIRMGIAHPLGRLNYQFDKKNSEKIREWARSAPAPDEALDADEDAQPDPSEA